MFAKTKLLIFISILTCLFCSTVFAKTLRVAVLLDQPPFSYLDNNNEPDGLAVRLWQIIAKQNNFHYKFIPISNISFDDAVKETSKGKYDVLVGPFSVTHERLKLIDYSRPYFLDKITLATRKTKLDFMSILVRVFGKMILFMFVCLSILLLIFGFVLWQVEKKHHEDVSQEFSKGFGYIIFIALVGFIRDYIFTPKTLVGRIIILIWLILSLIFIAVITAIATSTLTVALSQQNNTFDEKIDLYNKPIAVEANSNNERIAKRYDAKIIQVQTPLQGLKAVLAHKADAVLADYFILNHEIKIHHLDKLTISNLVLAHDEYAFIFPNNSKLIAPVDLSITKLQENRSTPDLCAKYIGHQYKYSCDF